MKTSTPLQLLAAAALGVSTVDAFDAQGNNNVAVYWGQNSAGGASTQQPLSFYCDDDSTDIILLSFLSQFFGPDNLPVVNFASACQDSDFPGTELLQCTQIGEDIKTCQSKGKKILLSLGGASGAYGFTSDSQAESFADQLWDLFGNGSSDTRPFGDAIIDGFDFDIEGGGTTGYVAFANQLRSHFSSDSSKDYYLSAAPQCPIPDANLNTALVGADFDFIFVQFYNNFCGMQNWEANDANPNFNYDQWDSFVKTQSANKDAKLYLGVPASQSAAGSGYTPIGTVSQAAQYLQSTYSSTFGGIMMWDASQAWANTVGGQNFAQGAKAALGGGSAPSGPAPVSSVSPVSSAAVSSLVPTPSSSSIVWWTPETAASSTALPVPSSPAPVASSSSISSKVWWTPSAAASSSVEASSVGLASSSIPAVVSASVPPSIGDKVDPSLPATSSSLTPIVASSVAASSSIASAVAASSVQASSVQASSAIETIPSSTTLKVEESSSVVPAAPESVVSSDSAVPAAASSHVPAESTPTPVAPSASPSNIPDTSSAVETSPKAPVVAKSSAAALELAASEPALSTTLQTFAATSSPVASPVPTTPIQVTKYITTDGAVEELITIIYPDFWVTEQLTTVTGTVTVITTILPGQSRPTTLTVSV